MNNFIKSWQQVDISDLPQAHMGYLELAQKNPQFIRIREKIYRALAGVKGIGVDVGCGLGLAAHELTELGLQVSGIDVSHVMITTARKKYPKLDFRIGSAMDLPVKSESLNFYRAERVYVHLQQVEQALSEAYRVLKPGGRLVLAEPDLGTMALTCSDGNKHLARAAIKAMAESLPNGHAGSKIHEQLIRAGFTNIHVTAYAQIFTELRLANPLAIDIALEAALTRGYLSQGQIEGLRIDLIDHENRNEFQFSSTAFIVSANRPNSASDDTWRLSDGY